jgi:hypothetical protein
MKGTLVVPPTFGPRCALCWEAFRVGEVYRSIWPKEATGVALGISVHPGCAAQLAPGDLTRIFDELRRRLVLPLNAVNGSRC